VKYYRILDDLDCCSRWFLGDVNFSDKWSFWNYVTVRELPSVDTDLTISIRQDGNRLDLTMADFEILIANNSVAELFLDNDVLKVPIKITPRESATHFVLVIKKELDCINRENSVFSIWEEGNNIRPDKAGQYRNFQKMFVDPGKIEELDIFRIKGFNVAVIVSERIKIAFENQGLTGVKFKEV